MIAGWDQKDECNSFIISYNKKSNEQEYMGLISTAIAFYILYYRFVNMIFIYIRNILHWFFRTGIIGSVNGFVIEYGWVVTWILPNSGIYRAFPCNQRPDGYYSLSIRPGKNDAARKNRHFMPQAPKGSLETNWQLFGKMSIYNEPLLGKLRVFNVLLCP